MTTTATPYIPSKIHLTVDVPVEKINHWNSDLNMNKASLLHAKGDIIDHLAIHCGKYGSETLEVDIKLVNGDGGPYLDCILFAEGCEVTMLEPGEGPLQGRYTFVAEDYPGGDGKNRHLEVIIDIRRDGLPSAESLLSGDHWSDGMPSTKIFPGTEFQCYSDVRSSHDGRDGDDILAQALARYKDAIENLTREEAIQLARNLHDHLSELHSNTGMSDTEPEGEYGFVIGQMFEEKGWKSVSRWDVC